MSSNYDAEFCNWSTRGPADTMMFLPSQRNYVSLLEFCTDSLCTSWRDDSVTHGRTMLKALVMLPDPDVIMSLSNWLGENSMPYMDIPASDLAGVAWGVAKIKNGESMWRVCHDPLGDALALKLCELAERHLSSAVWAFAVAGSKLAASPLVVLQISCSSNRFTAGSRLCFAASMQHLDVVRLRRWRNA